MSEQVPVITVRHSYAGADWIEKSLRMPMSPFGRLVADILGLVWSGIYHLPTSALKRVEWDSLDYITIVIRHELATFDSGHLTWLVVLAHDAAVRIAVSPVNMQHIALSFSPRGVREGRMWQRHPTLEDAATAIRKLYDVEARQ